MKEVIDRAQSAMNLILILSILAWWVNNLSVDVLGDIEPDFARLVQVTNDYYTGGYDSSLIAIGNEHSKFVSLVFGNLQFYRENTRDSLLEFAKDHRLSDVVDTGKRLPIDVTILVAQMIGSPEKSRLMKS